MAVGDRLFKLFRESSVELVASESSVCAAQIYDGTGLKVMHPLRFMEAPV